VTAIAATPHVRADFPTRATRIEAGVAELRRDFAAHEIPVDVLPGGEVDLAWLWGIGRDELERLTLAQTGRYLLVEFPYPGWPRDLAAAIRYLGEARDQGTSRPPGAEPGGPGSPRCARPAVDEGALVQVTAGSLEGRHGAGARVAAERLLQLGLVHVLATDAHGPHIPRGSLAGAARRLGDEELAGWLTVAVPTAIVGGRPVPRSPRG
jgi:protein-tyrosine phosphatase